MATMLANQSSNPTTSAPSELSKTLLRTLRVAPSFLILSLMGTAVAYLFHVPAKDRAVAAAVPLVLIFIISRIVVVMTPAPHVRPSTPPPLTFRLLSIFVFGTAFACLDFVLSAAIFALLGLPQLANGTVNLALTSGMLSSLGLLITVFYVLHSIGVDLTELILTGLWKAFSCPTILADRLSLPPKSC